MIEYCLSNVDPDTRRRLADDPDAVERTCLEHCGRCYRDAFLIVDGSFTDGADHGQLLADVAGEGEDRRS